MAAHGIANAHDLHVQSGNRIPITTAYRIVANEGQLDRRLSGLLEALCDVFEVAPCDLLEREAGSARGGKQKRSTRRG